MADYIKKLLSDLPEQFRDKERIKAINEVIGKQLQEVYDFFDDLDKKRTLQTAEGVQLDRIGDIVSLTRADAGKIIGAGEDYVMDDESYRGILGYKILLNTGNATYYDIVRGIRRFFSLYPIKYSESPEMPASFSLEIDVKEEQTILLYNVLPVKAAGVGMYYQFVFEQAIEVSDILSIFQYRVPHCGDGTVCGTYPRRATKGNTSDHGIEIEESLVGYVYSVTPCGTRPERATRGNSDMFLIELRKESGEYAYSVAVCGDGTVCGTNPDTSTRGTGNQGDIELGQDMNAYGYGTVICGTVPRKATLYDDRNGNVEAQTDIITIPYDTETCGTNPGYATSYSDETIETGMSAKLSVYLTSSVRCGTQRCGQKMAKGGR